MGPARDFIGRHGSHLESLEVVTDLMTIPDDALRFLLTYWHSRKGRADVPQAAALMPEDMRPALGHIMLVDLVDDGWDGIFRLYGTKVAERYGRDLTGYRISNVDGGTYISTFFRAINRLCFETRQPIYSCHQPPATVSVTYWRRLCMPLADAEGRIIRLLIGTVAGPSRAPRDGALGSPA